MCGIAGIVRFNGGQVAEAELQRMMAVIKHRGPDDEGTMVAPGVGLGFVRLSILDLSQAGHQPMTDASGRYTLIYNGEIYNYIELREELRQQGHQFRSQTDTEVLLTAYLAWGADCLQRLNGMFAFAVHDRETGDIFAARDRFGIKPFYYYRDAEQFIFASEIRAILTAMPGKPAPHDQAIFDYLVFNRTDQTDETFFNGIRKLQHGHCLTIRQGEVQVRSWYTLRDNLGEPFRTPEEYQELFASAVGLRLRSDVPVGVCLSGGLDSSSIANTIVKKHGQHDLQTFSAVYGDGVRGDEQPFIDSLRDDLHHMQFTHPSADTLFDDILPFIRAHNEPVPSTSPYAQYKVMELARQHVVVTLDGQGADEQLAGYHYFFGFFFKDLLRQFRWGTLGREMAHYWRIHQSTYGFKSMAYMLLPSALKTKTRMAQWGYVDNGFARQHAAGNVIAGDLYSAANVREALLQHFEYKLEHLLKWEDRNSMWFSLESRVPFLDHRLVERTLASSSDQYIQRGTTKHILREAMRGILPEKIRLRQDKIGFGTPQDTWFRSERFQTLIRDTIGSRSFRERGYVDAARVEAIYNDHLANKVDASKEIWKWLNLETWFREFIDDADA